MNSATPPLELLSSVVRPEAGRDRTVVSESKPETTDEGMSFDALATLPVS
jgi:hypothetical protein